MSDYWQKRFQAVEAMNNKRARETVQSITPAFDKAQAQIDKEINAWYARFAKNNKISLAEAKILLNSKELKEFRWDVQEYIKYGRENAIDQKWMKELENASSRFHISRLEALKIRTQNAAEVAFGNELDMLDQMAARMYMDDYYHTAYEIQRGLGIGWDVAQIDQRKLDKLLSKPWTADNKTFKDRIWTQKTSMISELHNQMTRMCILGKSPDEAIKEMEKFVDKKCKNAKMAAGRLVMTESAYFASAAQKDCFNDLGVEKFEVVATLDSHTSKICQDMDGLVQDMKDFQAGVTAPPFHVWCRSCTAPWFEDNDDGQRAARDADGKTYYVPANMKYNDWKNSFVDGGSKDGLKPVVTIEDLMKQVEDKRVELDNLKRKMNAVSDEHMEWKTGRNNPYYKKFHSMSDDEYQKYVDDLKKQERDLTAEYKSVLEDYDRYYERPARKTPEREEWDKWYEEVKVKYGIDDGGKLFEVQNDIYNKRSAVRDKLNDTLGFSNWKSKFGSKTEQDFIDEIANLTFEQQDVQKVIDDLMDQIESHEEYYEKVFKSKVRERLEKSNVEFREITKLDKELSIDEIIERVGGGDKTKGSCASLGFAYVGNRHGYNVLDFRDGNSRSIFATTSNLIEISNFNGVKTFTEIGFNDISNAKKLLKQVEVGKEYYFATGRHAAMVRKTEEGVLQYLELQSGRTSGYMNGWHNFDVYGTIDKTLRSRFGTTKSRTVYGTKLEQTSFMIDSDTLKDNPEFKKLLGYINTAESAQRKGLNGTIK